MYFSSTIQFLSYNFYFLLKKFKLNLKKFFIYNLYFKIFLKLIIKNGIVKQKINYY